MPYNELTEIQRGFLDALREYGNVKDALKHSKMSKQNLYSALRQGKTVFWKEFQKAQRTLEDQLEYSKLSNLESLREIRDLAMSTQDFDMAMKAMKMINDMKGHNAPVKKEVNETKVLIEAKSNDAGVIDMTKPVKRIEDAYDDVDYEDIDG
jgi:hypothetical protein